MKIQNDDNFIAHLEGGDEFLEQPAGAGPYDPSKEGCIRKDRRWMGIKPSDLKVIDELVLLEHPLKNSPMKLIYSDFMYRLTC